MHWEQELSEILQRLGVRTEQEDSDNTTPSEEVQEPFFLAHASHTYYGVFYRCDLLASSVVLRVYVPSDENLCKFQCYLVCLAPGSFHERMLTALLSYGDGSNAYQDIEGRVLYQQMRITMDLLKQLFWKGNLSTQSFPSEIVVTRVV